MIQCSCRQRSFRRKRSWRRRKRRSHDSGHRIMMTQSSINPCDLTNWVRFSARSVVLRLVLLLFRIDVQCLLAVRDPQLRNRQLRKPVPTTAMIADHKVCLVRDTARARPTARFANQPRFRRHLTLNRSWLLQLLQWANLMLLTMVHGLPPLPADSQVRHPVRTLSNGMTMMGNFNVGIAHQRH